MLRTRVWVGSWKRDMGRVLGDTGEMGRWAGWIGRLVGERGLVGLRCASSERVEEVGSVPGLIGVEGR